jgi:hypothetical protein
MNTLTLTQKNKVYGAMFDLFEGRHLTGKQLHDAEDMADAIIKIARESYIKCPVNCLNCGKTISLI